MSSGSLSSLSPLKDAWRINPSWVQSRNSTSQTKRGSAHDAMQIFMKECGSPEPEARREAYRGTSDPGYINYTVGKLEILKLRDDYRAKMGDKFSLADFHDRLLAGGLAPMKIIRREMMGADGPVL
jgi:uncharacterized protein (DUF885 family)